MTRRILIADDEPHIVQVLSLKLRHAGWDVVTAVDGEDALHQILAEPPDLVITDIQMPYMTGIDLCQELLQRAALSCIPVIVLTARGHALNASDAELPNICHLVSKPFSPRSITEQVRALLDTAPRPQVGRSEAA
ncbi:MAG: response regulator [Phycisphaerales bacterium]|jgi:DNA-binding response OmpR family regulator|nr:response regulator [Phycisphaerales bacterium]